MEKVSKVESLQEIIEEMTEADEASEKSSPRCLGSKREEDFGSGGNE